MTIRERIERIEGAITRRAFRLVLAEVARHPDRMVIVPEGFWSTQTPAGRMIDGRSVEAILKEVARV